MDDKENQAFPPTESVDVTKQLTNALQDLNKSLRTYFEIDVPQNTNAVAKLIRKISEMDETHLDLEKVLQNIPAVLEQQNATQRIAMDTTHSMIKAIEELHTQKAQENALRLERLIETHISRTKKEETEAFKKEREKEDEIRKLGINNIVERATKAFLGGRKERDKLNKELEEYFKLAKKDKEKRDPDEVLQERIDAKLKEKGLDKYANVETLSALIGQKTGEEVKKALKKDDTDKPLPPTDVVLTGIDDKTFEKLQNLFRIPGPVIIRNDTAIPPPPPGGSGVPPGGKGTTAPASAPQAASKPNVTPTTPRLTGPNQPQVPGGQVKALPPGGTPPQGGIVRPMINVTPNTPSGLPTVRQAGPMSQMGGIGGSILFSLIALHEAIGLGEDLGLNKPSTEEDFNKILSLFGSKKPQDTKSNKQVSPVGNLLDTADFDINKQPLVKPSTDFLKEQAAFEVPEPNKEGFNDLIKSINENNKLFTQFLQKDQTNNNRADTTNTTTNASTVNNNTAVNNIVYGVDTKISTNRDIFKENLKFNYKLLK